MHKFTDTGLDESLAENPAWSGLTQSRGETHARARVTRHASTMSALLMPALTEGPMTIEDAAASPVEPPNRRLV
jgi:hypothetical protein